jgi:tetratricopeptide (TPR) repeat protein
MTDAGRGLFDETPPAGDEPRAAQTSGPGEQHQADETATPRRRATDHPSAASSSAGAPVSPARVAPAEVHPRSRVAAIPDDAALVDAPHAAAPARPDEGRPVALRLAGLHVRMGSLALARAELESLAGRGMLDEPALLDLAEVRWRTGDLAGAGEAANALLARDRDDPLALVIAAESVSALGRPGEARRLAARALEGIDGPLEPLFAGIPRSMVWPADAVDDPSPVGGDAGEPLARPPAAAGSTAPRTQAGSPASTGAAEAFAGGRAALGAGDTAQAAVRLSVALRLEPGYARDVLAAVGSQKVDPALALVAGDALRLLGRESEALAAFDLARGHVHSPREPHVREAEAAVDPPDDEAAPA